MIKKEEIMFEIFDRNLILIFLLFLLIKNKNIINFKI